MPYSTNNNVPKANFCDVCNLFFEAKKGLYKHESYAPKQKELLEKLLDSDEDENMERVYDPDEDDYFLKQKDNTETETRPETVLPCWTCGETFENDTDLKTHMNKHWRKQIAVTNDYVVKSSFNQKQIFITELNNELIQNINEPVDYILDESIPFKSYKF